MIESIDEENSKNPCWLGKVSDGDISLKRVRSAKKCNRNGIKLFIGEGLNLWG